MSNKESRPKNGLQHVGGQILARVDALVLLDKHVGGDLHLGVGVVQGGVQHDDGEGEDETGVRFCRSNGHYRHLHFFVDLGAF